MNAIATLSDDDLLAVENAASIQAVYEAPRLLRRA